MSDLLETVELTTGAAPQMAIVWLHGLGADGHDFEPLVPELELPVPARFVFPHAPMRAVTVNGGLRMRAWYDIVGLDADLPEDEAGIRDSAARVGALLEREIARGIDPHKLVLAGFSQGGAVALHLGLREHRALAGLLALSTYLPLAAHLEAEKNAANLEMPLFMAHGDADPLVPLELALASKRHLETQGYRVEWHRYRMGHGMCPAEIADIERWLAERARGRL